MINLLRRIFIKDYNNINNNAVRDRHGILASIIGIIVNIILIVIKIIVGFLTMNLGILTDSVNNLGDASSSVVSLVGFKMSSKPADRKHPYGHERIEYIAGLFVSLIIICAGVVMCYTSVLDMINNDITSYSLSLFILTISLLLVSILLKAFQAFVNYKIGRLINSITLKATMVDSRNDILATSFVIVGVILIYIFQEKNISIDFSIAGLLGIIVSIYVIISGIGMAKDVLDPLIGVKVNEELIDDIKKLVKSCKYVLGIHDVISHSYGETKIYMTVHAEVDGRLSMLEVHDDLDLIERKALELYNVNLTIHMDPIESGNNELNHIKDIICERLENIKIHDLRFIHHGGIKYLSFDMVISYDDRMDESYYNDEVKKILRNNNINYEILINIDRE